MEGFGAVDARGFDGGWRGLVGGLLLEFAGPLGVRGLGVGADGVEERRGLGGLGGYGSQGVVPGGGVFLGGMVLLCEGVSAA